VSDQLGDYKLLKGCYTKQLRVNVLASTGFPVLSDLLVTDPASYLGSPKFDHGPKIWYPDSVAGGSVQHPKSITGIVP
jgi:hypothetical protein